MISRPLYGFIPLLGSPSIVVPNGSTPLQRLLIATDLSTRSVRALHRGIALARHFGAEATLLHVVEADQPTVVVHEELAQIQRALDDEIAQDLDLAGVRLAIRVVPGAAFQTIVDEAQALRAELVVMGAHRRNLLRDVFVGTTVERVIRTGSLPVLMVNVEGTAPYQRVVAAVDFSQASLRALRAAHEPGLLRGARLIALHAFVPLAKGAMSYAGVEQEQIRDHVEQSAAAAATRLGATLAGIDLGATPCETRVLEGAPSEVIRRACDAAPADLLVIGTRGATGLRRVLLGSVADEALRNAACDVLAVPPTWEGAVRD